MDMVLSCDFDRFRTNFLIGHRGFTSSLPLRVDFDMKMDVVVDDVFAQKEEGNLRVRISDLRF